MTFVYPSTCYFILWWTNSLAPDACLYIWGKDGEKLSLRPYLWPPDVTCPQPLSISLGQTQGLINDIDTKAKCRHLKKWTLKELCGRCLSEVTDWIYSVSCCYFGPSFVNCFPFNLLSGSTPPHPPFPCQCTVCTDSVWLGVGGGCVGDQILQSLTLCTWTDSNLQIC